MMLVLTIATLRDFATSCYYPHCLLFIFPLVTLLLLVAPFLRSRAYIDFYRLIWKIIWRREENLELRRCFPSILHRRARFSSSTSLLNTERVTILTTMRPNKCYSRDHTRVPLSYSSARDYA